MIGRLSCLVAPVARRRCGEAMAGVRGRQLDLAPSGALLVGGADAKAREPDGTTPLHYAAHYGDAASSRCSRPRPTQRRERLRRQPLAEAAASGSAEAIRLLLKAGADVESANPEGQTALMVVARTGTSTRQDAHQGRRRRECPRALGQPDGADVGLRAEAARDDPPAF